MPQPSLFDDMRQTQRRKYHEVLATGKAVVVLSVARALKQPFRLNDLSVACWQHDPTFFSMKGYAHHPDNHKIHTFLYGRRGLIARGLIDRVSEGLFEARLLGDGHVGPAPASSDRQETTDPARSEADHPTAVPQEPQSE